ncbi:uncharacterized protein LOC116915901 [Daphnia magna]|uniref:uncharacterized protein LOC116915901 n=1 Tax=Daphnia magna TaxID=35525 RepID=UPI001E1BB7C2|nr:uncharacterized protein LOC116915901 [Daphnia magna]XP_032776936.2 uncharacterized protein LOC116915901 [Daphnia magna]
MKIVIVLLVSLVVVSHCHQEKNVIGHASLNMPVATEIDVSNTTQQTSEEEKENDRKLMEQWTRMFFSMGRIPQQGEQILIFPGLFNGSTTVEVARPRELRNIEVVATTDNNSAILPAYFTDYQNSTEIPTVSTTTNSTVSSFIQLSNDSRLFFHDEEYHFEDVDSLDEDQRQRRRLRSARNEMNLLNADEEHITTMITTVFSTERNFLNNETIRANVVQYLTQKMRSFGLVTGNQIFHPIEFAALFPEGGEEDVPTGTNVIGILPGELWGTKEDEVLVIGAHWDTVPFSGGMDDNGSGVTAVLEVARAMTEGGCRPKHSIIFVAFDLEEVGCLGSIFFVRDFLIQQILQPYGAQLKGAYVLDTIMNYNETQFSQTLSPEWQTALPLFWEDIQAENKTGDFLAILYRKNVDATLADTLAYNWKNDGKPQNKKKTQKDNTADRNPRTFRIDNREITIMKTADKAVETVKSSSSKYRLKKVRMDLEAEVGDQLERLTAWIDLLRSDHSRFWYHNIEGYQQSFPAVLITDTAPYRGIMQECYHQECDSSSANDDSKFADVRFLKKTCQALIDSMVSLSESKCLSQSQAAETNKLRRRANAKQSTSSGSHLFASSLLPSLFAITLAVIRFIPYSS